MVDSNHQAAMSLSRNLNSNSRRASGPPQLREVIPRAAKKARTSGGFVTLTPQSTDPSMPPRGMDLDEVSSSLNSLLPSEQSISLSSQSMIYHAETSTKPAGKKGQQGTTDITISEGDRRSQPQPGLELLQMVKAAQGHGELAKIYDVSVVRRIDGAWMVPQMCTSCQQDSKSRCNRQSPCSSCVRNQKTCDTNGFMARLRKVGASVISQTSGNILLEANTSHPLTHRNVRQMSDGSWSLEPQESQEQIDLIAHCIGRAPADVERYSVAGIGVGLEDTSNSETESQKPKKSRSKKRKVEDVEFSPSHDATDYSDPLFSPQKPTTKSKIVAKGKARSRKVPIVAYHVNNQLNKPEPHGQPVVWADKRQQLCETLSYYRAYQSGAYTNKGIAFGLLIDAEVDKRDKFYEEVVITSVGGGRSTNKGGKTVRNKDQSKTPSVAAFMRNKDLKLPVVIIAGQGNKISPSKLPHYYNVLDWFHVTDVWAEKCEGMTTWKLRLEKICLTEKSWWAAKGSPILTQDSIDSCQMAGLETCLQCNKSSKAIYNAGWACLNTECSTFFQFQSGYDDATLDFTEDFLKERTRYEGIPPGPLAPPLLIREDMAKMDAFGIEEAFRRGIVCSKCGCCSRRIAWDHWFCENSNCDFTYSLKQLPMAIDKVIARLENNANSGSKPTTLIGEGSETTLGPWHISKYIIPGENGEVIGFVHHFKSEVIINQQKDGPNELFLQMQSGDLNLRRNAVRQKGSTGEILTSHWAANWGAPYKYGVSQLSTSFNEAPVVILKAIKRLTWAGEQTVTGHLEPFQPFNECLSIGYFENAKIGYHDDGEKELGPTVATLSLGAPAVMLFRPKAKNTIGSATGKGKASLRGEKPKKSEFKSAVLKIILEHGDIVVMHGHGIQQFYEHAVTPMGPLRYALTCRYVRPEMMANDGEARDAVLKGTLPPGSEKYNYDGDMSATAISPPATEVDKNN